MLTFKEFLIEGGNATKKLGTSRANAEDMRGVLAILSRATGMSQEELEKNLLGSTRLTFRGNRSDSGDIDVALPAEKNTKEFLSKINGALGKPAHVTGGWVYSYAVPVNGKKVQLDLMFTDVKWARFSHFADEKSKYKSGVRNELIHSLLKYSMEDGKDIRIKNADGVDLARASRAFKLDQGLTRVFKMAKKKADGEGYTKSVQSVSPEDIKARLKELNREDTFSSEKEVINDPEKAAKFLLGDSAKPEDLSSAEKLIAHIKKLPNAAEILKDAVAGIKARKFDVPSELASYQ